MTSTATHQPNLQGLAVLPADRTLPTATAPISRPRHPVQEYFPNRPTNSPRGHAPLGPPFFMETNQRVWSSPSQPDNNPWPSEPLLLVRSEEHTSELQSHHDLV